MRPILLGSSCTSGSELLCSSNPMKLDQPVLSQRTYPRDRGSPVEEYYPSLSEIRAEDGETSLRWGPGVSTYPPMDVFDSVPPTTSWSVPLVPRTARSPSLPTIGFRRVVLCIPTNLIEPVIYNGPTPGTVVISGGLHPSLGEIRAEDGETSLRWGPGVSTYPLASLDAPLWA